MAKDVRLVDPRTLLVTPARRDGADPWKLQVQIARFGASAIGMPEPVVYETPSGELVLNHGVTRATRMARLAPGVPIPVEVAGKIKPLRRTLSTIEDLLP